MAYRILVVCLGNICRSPTAEVVLRDRARAAGLDVEVDSAGTSGWHLGEPPHRPMIATARQSGYDLSPLRARQVSEQDFFAFDLILVADRNNLRDVELRRPAGNNTPVRLLADDADVPDPYYTGDYIGALQIIEEAADKLIAQLQ
ncbi:low molecular weight protein-tyrosine-phosphatase [Palleronia caenipelagi]|uniref:protein-tyrosine-phosphatase n=1 Tax=Palleronia caenipelagi TaxID=2489174 RepID=A0A547Q5A6_9RHOB|nr:low molecular weight protein-tyrosine-phosphatase [Palleronia caenipelagi]TRD21549.1 low molecular weight phosphotyrosine protein phosphatase [Palleronia caenipelagi]